LDDLFDRITGDFRQDNRIYFCFFDWITGSVGLFSDRITGSSGFLFGRDNKMLRINWGYDTKFFWMAVFSVRRKNISMSFESIVS